MMKFCYRFAVRSIEDVNTVMVAAADDRTSAFREDSVPRKMGARGGDGEVADERAAVKTEDSDARVDVVDQNLTLTQIPRGIAAASYQCTEPSPYASPFDSHFRTHDTVNFRGQTRLDEVEL
jgi:hypothetical protein